MTEKIIILDFGSQVTQLIARRVRELKVYCEIYPYNNIPVMDDSVKGIILSGSPCSVREEDSPRIDLAQLGDRPILGICYGAQLLAHMGGGSVQASQHREYGRAHLTSVKEHILWKGVSENSQVWMSHGDTIIDLPNEYEIIGSTESVKVAAFSHTSKSIFGIQFHPEVTHSSEGNIILGNFVLDVCACTQSWTSDSFVDSTIASLKEQLGSDKVVLGLSGGVDSSVAAVLLHHAIGKNLYCIFVDNGLLRKDEFEQVLESYQSLGLNVKGVNSKDLFYGALAGLSDPELKRKAIGKTFIEVFDHESHLIEGVAWLGQGTIYPDIIESVSVKGPSATIKSHHNVGGLPDFMKLKVVEPLKTLFKDEVRLVGKTLGIPQEILGRHPFPGPGLAIRILGDITAEKVDILQKVDAIFINGLKQDGLYDQVWQAGAILLPVQSVGVMGDERTYGHPIIIRAVTSDDAMTADWARLPYDLLEKMSNRIINEVAGINRVVSDVTSKPPGTIEWE
jgi:GMP synthase (glutamine-hydrolysing)